MGKTAERAAVQPAPSPLGDVLRGRAAADPDAVAVMSSARKWTYGDLAMLAGIVEQRIAQANGHRPGVIAVEATTRCALALGVVASAAVATAAPLPMDHPADRRAALLSRLRPIAVLDSADLIESSHLESPGSANARALRPGLDDPAIILSTSGSTSEPKLVPNTHRNLWASARAAAVGQRLGPGDRCLALGSMAHVLGLRAVTDVLWCGGAVIIPDELTVDAIASHLREHHPTCVVAPPPLLNALATAVEGLPDDERDVVKASLRYIRSGAAALRPGLIERLGSTVNASVIHGYGMTEVAKIAFTPIEGGAPSGSVGRPVDVELRLEPIDPDEDEVGEILVRGDVVAPGYFDDRHESASAFEDGWFRTGDVGRLDADGHLYLLGRRDETVTRGGVALSLVALEGALETHPGIQAALATAVDHPTLGTDVVLAYVRVPGGTSNDGPSPREFLTAVLPASQVPTRIVEIEELPLAASGKPSRKALAALVGTHRDVPGLLADVTDPEIDGIELELAALWSRLLMLDTPVLPDDDFFALGADSLHIVELCTMVAETFGADVLPGEMIDRSSLHDMAALVREGAERTRRPILVPLRSGEPDRLPLYMVPGAGGTLAALQLFVFQLESGRRVRGFEAPGLYHGEHPLASISELAALYVDELLADLGDEQYALAGASFGSVVVHEMAKLLEGHGRPPELLVMFDCRAPRPHPRVGPLRRVAGRVRHPSRLRKKTGGDTQTRIRREVLASHEARRNHQPREIAVPTLMFTSEAKRKAGDPLLGWGPYLCGPVNTVEFPGVHRELIRDRAADTSRALDRALTELDRLIVRQ